MKCASCGADLPDGTLRCEFCGSRAVLPLAAAEALSRDTTFARIADSPEYARRETPQRLAGVPNLQPHEIALPVVILSLFIAVSVFIAGATLFIFPCFAIVPLAFVAIGIVLLVVMLQRSLAVTRGRLQSWPAIVSGKRMEISGGGKNSSAKTNYFATFEFSDGGRRELPLRPQLFGELSEEDAGVLFARGPMAMAFDRIV